MCGFVGFHSKEGSPSSLLEEMANSIAHRGPDDQGFLGVDMQGKIHTWKTPGEKRLNLKIGLGFRRLAIIDLSPNGAQPMTTVSSDRHWITFNGEIYNYVELKERLSGVALRSTSDTEILLNLLSRDGIDTLGALNGIFAFAFLDTKTKELTLARDQFGVKPLYYAKNETGLFFGSEIRPLLKAIPRPRLNRKILSRYLMCNWVADPDTLYEGIYRVNPGCILKVSPSLQLEERRYWDLNLDRQKELPLSDWLGELDATLDKAVERQLRADVPIAFFLSGGIDSSLLAVKAKEVAKYPTSTYTIGFNWSHAKEDSLDVESSRFLAKRFGFNHKEIILSPSIVGLLPKVIDTLEEPISDPAAICSYLICEAAKGEFKVLVSGQGGDEMFGGYSQFTNALLTAKSQKLPGALLSALNVTAKILPYSVAGKRVQSVHRLKKFLHVANGEWPEALFQLRSSIANIALEDILLPDVLAAQSAPYGRHGEIFETASRWDTLRQSLYIDTKTYLPALNLFYTDKTSMANSIEVRVPYLDMDIARLVETLPNRWKVHGRETKILLKKLAERFLPPEITHRKKTGFGLPVRDWLLHDLQPMARELLSPERLKKQGLFHPETFTRWLAEHQDRKADHSSRIYLMMTLQLWLERFHVQV